MQLKIKDEYLDMLFSSPFTGKMTHMRFLSKLEYPHWYNVLPHLFEGEITNYKKKYINATSK